MEEILNFVKGCPCYFIATCEGDQPRVRPFGTFNEFEGKLYVQTGHVKPVAHQIAANPKVEISAFDGKGTWCRITAVLVEDPRIEAKKAMLDAYPELRSMYDENDGNTAVYYLTQVKASICSFTDPVKTFEF